MLRQNIILSQQNKQLEKIAAKLSSTQGDFDTVPFSFLLNDAEPATQSQPVTAAEDVPETVSAPPPPPPADFNGASAVIAHQPFDFSHEPAVGSGAIDTDGEETRGSFRLERLQRRRRHLPPGGRPGTYLRVTGRPGHRLDCTLRGFRALGAEFAGATVSTGAPPPPPPPPNLRKPAGRAAEAGKDHG